MSETANELSLRLARLEREVAELRAREAIRDLLAYSGLGNNRFIVETFYHLARAQQGGRR